MKYVLIQFPEVQELMNEHWFKDEAILAQPSEGQDWVGSSAYFVPTKFLVTDRVREEVPCE